MKRMIPLLLILSLLLCGCADMLDGSYHDQSRHEYENAQKEEEIVSVSTYSGLRSTLCSLIAGGTENCIVSVVHYDQERIASDLEKAVEDVLATDAIAAYAVETITFEQGSYAGQSAVALEITYLHGRSEIQKIRNVEDMEQAGLALAEVLNDCSSGTVLRVERYEDMDITQWVKDYAAANPHKVMELPEVTVNLYPEEGQSRVVELKFTYQNSRDALRTMQSKVNSLFSAATVYAGGDSSDTQEQFFKLYSFLMGLFQSYRLETSITPAYSLLQHGVGDSRAFATVYAAMCQDVGLECMVITGNKSDSGEPWYWNMVCSDGIYYHVDLLACSDSGEFELKFDDEMTGYVWDYSAYPIAAAEQGSDSNE